MKTKIKISDNPDKNWKNDAIQFPRLIAEIEVAGGFTESLITTLSLEMDLTKEEIILLIDRAQTQWDKIKAKTIPRT